MRDVSHKFNTYREATASVILKSTAHSISRVRAGDLPKGDALTVAKVAAVQAAKNTPDLIPYCHPVPVEFVGVEYEFHETQIKINVTVKAVYKTGVEMEALAAASAAALNIYDLLKMVEDDIEITDLKLDSKKGGKSGLPKPEGVTAAVITVSDRASSGEYEDLSGPAVKSALEEHGVRVLSAEVVPDERQQISEAVQTAINKGAQLVVTTGGTGASSRDVTPEALTPLVEKRLHGIEHRILSYGVERTPMAASGRPLCGISGGAVVLCLPGSPKAAEESLFAAIHPALHTVEVLSGTPHPVPE